MNSFFGASFYSGNFFQGNVDAFEPWFYWYNAPIY